MVENYLTGAYEMNVHTSPDVVQRKLDDKEMAERALKRGMKGLVLKNHYSGTAARARGLKEKYPSLLVWGGIALNDTVRVLDPNSVEEEAKTGGKFVWFPTLEAYNYRQFKNQDTTGKISILENGKLKKSVYEILEIIKAHKMILSAGHISKYEALALVTAGNKMGIEKMILTHADLPPIFTTSEEQKKFVSLGAYIEHSYYTVFKGETSWEVMLEQIQAIGCDHIIISSDMGQFTSPYPDDGLNEFADGLLSRGISRGNLEKMLISNPEILLR
jgi:hypothetical protein